jgi:tyrosine-protein phosphatase YwqE
VASPPGTFLHMIDLHCHLLPAIDDGATDLETALAMARIAVDDGMFSQQVRRHGSEVTVNRV